MSYRVHFSCISHKGNCRRLNQDNFICNGKYMENESYNMELPLQGCIGAKASSVFGIFDGMGGEECGEIASYIAAKNAAELVLGRNASNDLSRFCIKVNDDICKYAKENLLTSMGTTAALLAFTRKEIVLCNIGDSKIFRFSKGRLEQISEEHIAIAAFGLKPPLSQNLGIPSTELLIEPYMVRGSYHDGDIYLICSDGLTDMIGVEEIQEVLVSTGFDEIVQSLLSKALVRGGKDNISMIVCRIEREFEWLLKCKTIFQRKEV